MGQKPGWRLSKLGITGGKGLLSQLVLLGVSSLLAQGRQMIRQAKPGIGSEMLHSEGGWRTAPPAWGSLGACDKLRLRSLQNDAQEGSAVGSVGLWPSEVCHDFLSSPLCLILGQFFFLLVGKELHVQCSITMLSLPSFHKIITFQMQVFIFSCVMCSPCLL